MIRYIMPVLFSLFLAGATLHIKDRRASRVSAAPAQAAPVAAAAPVNDREQFAADLLASLGNGQPTAETVAFVVEWTIAEDGSGGALGRNNPLNTTICGHNWTGAINGDGACGVGGYGSYQDGIAATRDTLLQQNFSAITAALQANDPEGARRALWDSPWAASHYGYGAGWPHYQIAPQAAPAPALSAPEAQAIGEPYLLRGDVGTNVSAALNANGGALMGFTIPPGQTWSFGHTIAPISGMGYLPVVCGPAGCNAGGGWCDLSALYVRVADQLGLESHFPAHAGVSDPRFPGILLDDAGNGGDLTITNTTGQAVTFQTRVDGDRLIVEGGF